MATGESARVSAVLARICCAYNLSKEQLFSRGEEARISRARSDLLSELWLVGESLASIERLLREHAGEQAHAVAP